jgi:hypothetical protein
MSQKKVRKYKALKVTKKAAASALVVTVDELRSLLGVGRNAAYRLAQKLGVRISGHRRGRLLVARERLDEWLRGQRTGGAS